MAQPDYRDGVYDDQEGNINPVVQEVYGRISGAVPGYVNSVMKLVIEEFYRKSLAWREFVEIGTLSNSTIPYDINPIDSSNKEAFRVTSLALNGITLRNVGIGKAAQWATSQVLGPNSTPTAYYLNPNTRINFLHEFPEGGVGNFVATVALMPRMTTDELPQWLIDEHRDAFVSGTLHRLHNEINKPYTDPYKAQYYGKEWRFYLAQHKTIADKNYGTSEHEWYYPRGTM